jgi:hypothetical protein
MNKIRVNITINKEIHEKAKFFSLKEGKSLSENIEDLLTHYYWQKAEGIVSEPTSHYNSTLELNGMSPLQNSMSDIFNQLHPEQQIELFHYGEYLLSKNPSPTKKISLHGIFRDQIMISEDFDEPLDIFKDYMPLIT